jgi:hypothetical protein
LWPRREGEEGPKEEGEEDGEVEEEEGEGIRGRGGGEKVQKWKRRKRR